MMQQLVNDLKKFSKMGTFVLDHRDAPIFDLISRSDLYQYDGIVYMWIIEEKRKSKKICYIGSTRKTFSERCGAHANSFVNKSHGQKQAQQIVALLKSGKTVSIYARVAPINMTAFGPSSDYKAEEDALIKSYIDTHPLFNKHGKYFCLYLEDLTSGRVSHFNNKNVRVRTSYSIGVRR